MNRMGRLRILAVVLSLSMVLCGGCRPGNTPSPSENATPSTGEMRGVWVSYLDLQALLADTDPSTAMTALDTLMDTCLRQGLNTVFFHVRSHSDAWYASGLFPAAAEAASLLSGGFDPLAYAIDAAHRRGLSLHAWVNPYRIGTDPTRAVTSEEARFQKDGVWYYDPAHPEAQQAIVAGVREILDNYQVDGIHFDDYFYPAGMAAEGEAFEDIQGDAALWRQTQVNTLICAVYGLVHNRDCLFGVSPAGTPAACTAGYADVATWMTVPGYIDYICPQIYFGFQHETKAFGQVLTTWATMSRLETVRLYVGLALYKAGMADDPYAGTGRQEWAQHHDILARQVQALRAGGADGFALFRYSHLIEDSAPLRQERQALAVCL